MVTVTMRLWLIILLTTSVCADDGFTTSGPADDGFTTSGRADDGFTTSGRADGGSTTSGRGRDELTACEKLEKTWEIEHRDIFVQGRKVPLVVQWDGHAPARAAAALLHALISRGLKYRGVQLKMTDENPLANAVFSNTTIYDRYRNLLVWPAAAQRTGAATSGSCDWDRLCSLRVADIGPGAAPAAVTLLAHLATDVADLDECKESNTWGFFRDETALRRCKFTTDSEAATVYFLREYKNISEELTRRAEKYGLRWRLEEMGDDAGARGSLLQLLRAGNHSFLFIDHEVWGTYPRVTSSQPPPCISTPCSTSLDPVYTVKLANAVALDKFLPNVLNVIRKFSPTHEVLRQILELEAEVNNTEEAACVWSLNNTERFESWFDKDIQEKYWIIIFICNSEPDFSEYNRVVETILQLPADSNFRFVFKTFFTNCSSDFNMTNIVELLTKYRRLEAMMGVVGLGEGAKTAAAYADSIETALVLYESISEGVSEATRVMGGPVSQLAAAIAWFLGSCGWTRLAVMTDRSSLAKGIYKELEKTSLVLRNRYLLRYTDAEFKEYLESFRDADARIFYLNTDANTAERVLCAAMELKMTFDDGYVWLVREWRAWNRTCGSVESRVAMRHYTASFWWRGQDTGQEVDPTKVNVELREKLQSLWKDRAWPVLAAPLADGLLLLWRTAQAFLTKHHDRASDRNGEGTTRMFWASLNNATRGVTREITADASAPLVYIDEWRVDSRPRSLAVWPAAGGGLQAVCGKRTDGGKKCLTLRWYKPGDSFEWRCHDWAFLATGLAVALAVPALFLARRARLSRLRRRERMLKARHVARSRRAADALAGHLVDRATLELRHELGAGRFGRVRLAILRTPGRSPTVVAAKALPDDATASEEGEFLKEACTMASLQHDHIVRLVGVCATDGPPLVLMEYAFFGDLSAYLRERRHLAERIDEANEEAEHVSAVSLTRLASEAASALAYLATKRLVHRDVRAANCLVDARRSLKLADFGLARQTAGGEEYACARRGFFPVLWMAPESLDRGVFSAASDVWALGVLLFELVTLGERPYGDWNPLAVFRYVVGGGRPPLPPDASIKTIGVLTSCWRRAPEQRPTAEAVCAYLRARPGALAPALCPAPPPADPACPPHTPTRMSL